MCDGSLYLPNVAKYSQERAIVTLLFINRHTGTCLESGSTKIVLINMQFVTMHNEWGNAGAPTNCGTMHTEV